MASYTERITNGLATDLVAMGSTGKLPADTEAAESLLIKAATEAVKVYTTTLAELKAEAADTDKTKAERTKANAKIKAAKAAFTKAATEAAEAEAATIAEAATAKATKTTDLMAVIAEAAKTKAEAIATATEAKTKAIAEAEAVISELERKATEAEAIAAEAATEAAKAILGTPATAKGDGKTKTATKVTKVDYWLIGPHRNGGKAALLSDKTKWPYTAHFLLDTDTRALYCKPLGNGYGKPLGKYADLKVGEWYFVGRMVDTKATRSLTGIVRYCHTWIKTADLEAEATEHTEAVNRRALQDNLNRDAGGTVFATEAKAEDYPILAEPLPDTEAAEDTE